VQAQRLRVVHETVYRYRQKVVFGEHQAMFRPRDSHDLRLVDATLSLSPGGAVRWRHDVFGNSIALISFDEPAEELRLTSEILIDHFAVPNPVIELDDFAERLPFTYAPDDLPDLGRTIERHYPDPDREIDAWARHFFAGDGATDTLQFLKDVTCGIHNDFRYERRKEIGVRPPIETLQSRAGSCRDYALLMMEALRSVGVAARFVTGYVYDPAVDGAAAGVQGSGATHAWVQAYLPGAGWVEFDPTNGIIGNHNLIRVGVARDPSQAVPLQGVFTGASDAFIAMDASVVVTAEDGPTKAIAA